MTILLYECNTAAVLQLWLQLEPFTQTYPNTHWRCRQLLSSMADRCRRVCRRCSHLPLCCVCSYTLVVLCYSLHTRWHGHYTYTCWHRHTPVNLENSDIHVFLILGCSEVNTDTNFRGFKVLVEKLFRITVHLRGFFHLLALSKGFE